MDHGTRSNYAEDPLPPMQEPTEMQEAKAADGNICNRPPSRLGRGTVERFFETLNRHLQCILPGYAGSKCSRRLANVKAEES